VFDGKFTEVTPPILATPFISSLIRKGQKHAIDAEESDGKPGTSWLDSEPVSDEA
jgi:hypothetical protein